MSNKILPTEGFARLPQIIGNPKANPPIPSVIPVSKSAWWAGCKEGRFLKLVGLDALNRPGFSGDKMI
jgi:hypothetical protein